LASLLLALNSASDFLVVDGSGEDDNYNALKLDGSLVIS
jgi:hypothetical protein